MADSHLMFQRSLSLPRDNVGVGDLAETSTRPSPDVMLKPNRRVLLLSYWFLPQARAGAARPARFAAHLPTHGFEVEVIAASSPDTIERTDKVLRVPTGSHRSRWRSLQIAVARAIQRVLPYNEQLAWLPDLAASAAERIGKGDISVIISTSPPTVTHLAALWLKRRFGVKWIADFRDPIANSPYRNRPWTKYYNIWLEALLFRNADAILAVTDTVADDWKRKYPQWAHKIHLLWNGYDSAQASVPRSPRADGRKVIAHVGTIYRQRNPSRFLEGLSRLASKNLLDLGRIRIDLIGSVDQGTELCSQTSMRRFLEHGALRCTGEVPRADAMRAIQDADSLLLLDSNDWDVGYTVPAKLFEYAQAGRPILAHTARTSPVDRILAQSGLQHRVVYSDEPEAETDRKILEFLALPSSVVMPSQWFLKTFDGKQQVEALAKLLDTVIVRAATP